MPSEEEQKPLPQSNPSEENEGDDNDKEEEPKGKESSKGSSHDEQGASDSHDADSSEEKSEGDESESSSSSDSKAVAKSKRRHAQKLGRRSHRRRRQRSTQTRSRRNRHHGEQAANIAWELGDEFSGDWLPTIVTTEDVYVYLDSTTAQLDAIDRDIRAGAETMPKNFLITWSKFLDEWRDFFTKQRNTTHLFGAANIMDQIDVFVDRLKKFQEKAKELGSPTNAPGVVTNPDSRYVSGRINWTAVAVVSTIAISTVVVLKIVK